MSRTMRARSVLSESWRNLASGTSRGALLAAAFTLAVGALAVVDVRAQVDVLRQAATFRSAGASVQVLEADAGVDGARCDAVGTATGVHGAGALRLGTTLRALAMPSTDLTVWDVTPGLPDVLTAAGSVVELRPGAGVWLSQDLATTLGARAGGQLVTTAGTVQVAGVYDWPDDGRVRTLGYAILAPVAATGSFDQCWTEVWPTDARARGLLVTALTAGVGDGSVSLLNAGLGAELDVPALLAARPTRYAPAAAALLGFALGWASVRARRLELASALHARVPTTHLAWQHLAEATVWATVGALVVTAVVISAARAGNPDPAGSTLATGLRTLAAGSAGVLLGTLTGVAAVREKHLFRYFRDR